MGTAGCTDRRADFPLRPSSRVELTRITHLSDFNISHLADNVVLLQYVWSGPNVKRALTVLKARASALEPTVREFKIRPDGIVLGDELEYGHDIR